MVSGAKRPKAGDFSRIFVLKVLLAVIYRKMGEQDILLASQ